LSGEVVHLGDISHVSRQFADTAKRAASGGYRACLFVPIVGDVSVWGHVGFVRKARQPFDPTGTAYLRAACEVFALALRHCSSSRAVADVN
jgi:hypothetical protein